VQSVVQAVNIAEGDRRSAYQLDWTRLWSTLRNSKAEGTEVIGFYHSHPDGASTPSRRDVTAAWPDRSYVLLTLIERGGVHLSSWRLRWSPRRLEREDVLYAGSCETLPGVASWDVSTSCKPAPHSLLIA